MPVFHIQIAFRRQEKQPVLVRLGAETFGDNPGFIAIATAEVLNLFTGNALHGRAGEILSLQKSGIALGIVRILKQQHNGPAPEVKGVDALTMGAGIKQQDVNAHHQQCSYSILSPEPEFWIRSGQRRRQGIRSMGKRLWWRVLSVERAAQSGDGAVCPGQVSIGGEGTGLKSTWSAVLVTLPGSSAAGGAPFDPF